MAAVVYLWTQPSDTSVDESTRAAQSAAERAVVPVLSYDASTLEDDQAEARAFLTSDYRSEYDKLFEVIKQNAPSTETKVDVEVVASGVVRSGSESDRVEILLFVNRPTTNKAQLPAGGLQGPGHADHGERRRRLADRRHGDLTGGSLAGGQQRVHQRLSGAAAAARPLGA